MSVPDPSALLETMERRFRQHPARHPELAWEPIARRLRARPESLGVLDRMERTGGEPDVIGHDRDADEYLFCDCSPESPAGRRGLCFDEEALRARTKDAPSGSAQRRAAEIGITLLDESQYRTLQALGEFDRTTSSWIATPDGVRRLGGALFGDRRYGVVFVYHNGAGSYFASRGFRGLLRT